MTKHTVRAQIEALKYSAAVIRCAESDEAFGHDRGYNEAIDDVLALLPVEDTPQCRCEIDRHDFGCPLHNATPEASRRPADDDLRNCICADPENCREPVEGYVCRRGSVASRRPAEKEMPEVNLTLLTIAGLVNTYHNDGTQMGAAETLRAIADALGPALEVTPKSLRRPASAVEGE